MQGMTPDRLAGCIKWLPRKDYLIPPNPDIEEGCCNHPVVILSTRPRSGRVEIFTLTTFGGRSLEIKFPTQQLARHNYLPITPSETHPDNGIRLVLRDPSQKLKKKSYVNTRYKRIIFLASLKPYYPTGPEIFLSARSYQTLVEHTKFIEIPYSAAEYAESLRNYSLRKTEDNYTHHAPRVIAPRAVSNYESQLRSRVGQEEYRHSFGSYATPRATYPVRPGYGYSPPETISWNFLKFLFWMPWYILYGWYRITCWGFWLPWRIFCFIAYILAWILGIA